MLGEENLKLEAGSLESPKMPTLLYRYTKLEYLELILKGRGLFFPKLSSFNDPFDANIFLSFRATKAERRKFYDAMLKSFGMSRAERKQRLRKTKDQVDGDLLEEAHAKTIRETRAGCGVLCLAESQSDILMWSHYGDRHTGVCLIFDTGNDFFHQARRVVYQRDYPVISFRWFSEKMTDALGVNGDAKKSAAQFAIDSALFLTKAEHWKYEAEWRIAQKFPRPLRNRENGIFFPFPAHSLVGVVIGANADEASVATVRNWIDAGPLRPQLLRARVSKTKFALDISEQG
ncbi:MAG: DUF2971 domain-containing protein [Candidatus Binatus sp.]|uniref:DUF2971 domain-containing protein n=1 Tax=Candidatus Binatus sp. TaxID=2811406 RepID=UPI003BAEECA6